MVVIVAVLVETPATRVLLHDCPGFFFRILLDSALPILLENLNFSFQRKTVGSALCSPLRSFFNNRNLPPPSLSPPDLLFALSVLSTLYCPLYLLYHYYQTPPLVTIFHKGDDQVTCVNSCPLLATISISALTAVACAAWLRI